MQARGLARFVACKLCVEFGEQKVGALKAVVLVLKIAQGAKKQSCADQQEQREHDLDGNQRVRPEAGRFAATALRGAAAGVQIASCSGACRGQGGGESEEEPGEQREAQREKHDGRIRPGVHRDIGVALADEGDQHARGGEGNAQSQHSAGEGEQEGLDQALADEACAAGAKGKASGDFALSSGGAGQ